MLRKQSSPLLLINALETLLANAPTLDKIVAKQSSKARRRHLPDSGSILNWVQSMQQRTLEAARMYYRKAQVASLPTTTQTFVCKICIREYMTPHAHNVEAPCLYATIATTYVRRWHCFGRWAHICTIVKWCTERPSISSSLIS